MLPAMSKEPHANYIKDPERYNKSGQERKRKPGAGRPELTLETKRAAFYIPAPQHALIEPLCELADLKPGRLIGGLLNDEARRRGLIS
jgi:hypothetical protein